MIQISLGPEGNVVGSYDEKPFLNSIIYDVEFNDGTVKEYSANVIAENMLTQVELHDALPIYATSKRTAL